MKPKIDYVVGPMHGISEYNYPAFKAEVARLRAQGHRVLCPTEPFAGDQTLPYETYMRQAMKDVDACTRIVALPGWEHSPGALREIQRAAVLGKPIVAAGCEEPIIVDLVEDEV